MIAGRRLPSWIIGVHRVLLVLAPLLLAACSTPGQPPIAVRMTRTAVADRSTPTTTATQTTSPVQTTPSAAQTTPVQTPPTLTASTGLELIEEAMHDLFENPLTAAVVPLNSAELYAAAFDRALHLVQATGIRTQAVRPQFTGDPQKDRAVFRPAYLALAQAGGTTVNQTELAHETLRAALDRPNECSTGFLDPAEVADLRADAAGTLTFGGIGLHFDATTHPPTITEVDPGAPAAQAGLRPGDWITAVDHHDVRNVPTGAVIRQVRGPVGSQVVISIERPGEPAPRDVTLVRATIRQADLAARILAGPQGARIGYLKLAGLSSAAAQQFGPTVERFQGQGVTGWILDLRNNGFIGVLENVATISGRFIDGSQPVGYRRLRGGVEVAVRTNPSAAAVPRQPVAILVNHMTGGSAELLAAALQEDRSARLFGEHTGGCASLPAVSPLADGSALLTPVAELVSPKKRSFARRGLAPDEEVAVIPTGSDDPAVTAAVRWLAGRH